MADSERRSFFRINNELVLSYQSVDSYTIEHHKAEDQFPEDVHSVHLFEEMQRLNMEASSLLAGLGETNRHLVDYLAIQSRKIDLLAQHSLSSQYLAHDVKPTLVNLSEGGVAFVARKPVYKGSQLALRMMFLDTFTVVVCFAKVIRCEEKGRGEYQIALKFLELTEIQQQALSKNIFQAQVKARKQKSSGKD